MTKGGSACWLVVVLIAVGYAGWSFRDALLAHLAKPLMDAAEPVKADLIAVLRGDEITFERARAGARLLREGYAGQIYVSSALEDTASAQLLQHGISMTSAQQRIVSVLRQLEVPGEAIVIDLAPPGGGTAGELLRLKRMMAARGLRSVLIATSWYHTRRSRRLADLILAPASLTATIVEAQTDSNIAGWWHRRYDAMTVLEELSKLFIERWLGGLHFADDPAGGMQAAGSPSLASSCALPVQLGMVASDV